MKWFFKRGATEAQKLTGNEDTRVVRLRRFGLRHFSLPRPRLAHDRARTQGWLRLPAE